MIHLRAIEPEDLDNLYDIENDDSLWKVGVTNVPYSRYMLHDYIAQASGDIYADKQVRLMIENDERSVVGMIDITSFSPSHNHAEIGIVIKEACRRQGYARASLLKVIAYSRDILHLHQLYAFTDAKNIAAKRLFASMGFKDKHTLKDWLFDGHRYHDAILFQLFL